MPILLQGSLNEAFAHGHRSLAGEQDIITDKMPIKVPAREPEKDKTLVRGGNKSENLSPYRNIDFDMLLRGHGSDFVSVAFALFQTDWAHTNCRGEKKPMEAADSAFAMWPLMPPSQS